ncbi:MAG TPA: ABC transporter permease [Terracidiphilus sp.]|nr:ABC transporter permease [Terracidiphilus sp.]
MWPHLKSALRNLLRKQRVESDLDEEIRSYVHALADEKIAAGVSPAEAHRRALAESGGIERVKQAVRNDRAGTLVESLAQDLRFGIRQLRRNPAFTWTAATTLGLGIGATTAVFSAVYALLLRPLPFPESGRLSVILQTWPRKTWSPLPMISQDFVAARSTLKSFQSLAGFVDRGDSNLTGSGDPVRVKAVLVTANFLPMLGIAPRPGRNFLPSEDRAEGPAVILLSHRLWESKFHGDPAIVGRAVTLDGKTQTVVGVLPDQFLFPDPGIEPDVYYPAAFDADTSVSRNSHIIIVNAIARLRDGVSAQRALAELQAFAAARAKSYAAEISAFADGRRLSIEPLQRHLTGDDRRSLLLLLACVAAVLMIACANVANLQLARALTRRHETAVRGALGATRRRLVRQFLVESLTLSALATAIGLVIALAATWLVRQGGMPGAMAGTSQVARLIRTPIGKLGAAVEVDGTVLLFIAGLALLTTILFGLAPAINSARTDLRRALQATAQRMSAVREQRLLRHGLLIAEISLGVALLAAAGLLIRSFANELAKNSGFDPSHTLTGAVQFRWADTARVTEREFPQVRNFVDLLLPRLQSIPGVHTAAVASALPLSNEMYCPNSVFVFGEGPLPLPDERQGGCVIAITPDYFRAAGTLLLKGRFFNASDNSASDRVAIVNQEFARLYMKGNPLGGRFRTNVNSSKPGTDFTFRTIVGIVQDVPYNGLDQGAQPEVYLPFDQVALPRLNLMLRADVAPDSLSAAMRQAVTAVDRNQPLFDVETMDERVADVVAPRRMMMLLTASFALLAVVLSTVGVYGVFAYSVSQRKQEMGIRMALGASRAHVVRLVSMQALRLILAGSALGLCAELLLSKLLASMLVGVTGRDPISLSAALLLMIVVAFLASMIPAADAARTDLITTLRAE